MNDKVEQALYDIIDRGMSTDALLAESVVRANFIGIRGTEEINQLVTEEPPLKSKALSRTLQSVKSGKIASKFQLAIKRAWA
jgi:hypothetical protein